MKHPPQEHKIVVERNGKRHEARYIADKGALTVYFGTATIQGTYGRLLAKDEARLLFDEYLVQNGLIESE